MIKKWVLKDASDENKFAVVITNQKPEGAICEAPEEAESSDGEFIIVSEIDGKMVAQLNVSAKNAAAAAKQEQKNAVQYQEARRLAYPSIGDQMDAMWKRDHLGDSTEWDAIAAQIAAVKAMYPKPE